MTQPPPHHPLHDLLGVEELLPSLYSYFEVQSCL
jgi:hypothetical protein